jgi:hypothetical protein
MRSNNWKERREWKVVGCLRSLGKRSAENSNGQWAESKYGTLMRPLHLSISASQRIAIVCATCLCRPQVIVIV